MLSSPSQQPNNSQIFLEVPQATLWKHKIKLEELLTLLYSGEDRSKIAVADIEVFESDLRYIIADLRTLRNEKSTYVFVESVDAIVDKVSDAVDNLYLAAATFKPKGGGLKQRLLYFKECRQILEETLHQFLPMLVQPEINEDIRSA